MGVVYGIRFLVVYVVLFSSVRVVFPPDVFPVFGDTDFEKV